MPAPTNTITTSDINFGIEVDFVRRYEQSIQRLLDILGIFGVEQTRAGQVMKTYTVSGQLNTAAEQRAEGEEVPLSKYGLTTATIDQIGFLAERKMTTGEAIAASGYEAAVAKTDEKFRRDCLTKQFDDFLTWLVPTGTPESGTTLQAALAKVDAKLADTAETAGYSYDNVAHFVPRSYVTDFLADADLTLTGENMFGLTYLENFLGTANIFVTNKVSKIVATPADNIRIFGIDYGELAKGELTYTTGDMGLIGIAHEPAKDRVSTQTHVLMPKNNFYAEITSFIVAGEVA